MVEILVALIGASATIATAYISRPSRPSEVKSSEKIQELNETEYRQISRNGDDRGNFSSRFIWGFVWAAAGFFYVSIAGSLVGSEYTSQVPAALLFGSAPGMIFGLIYGKPTKPSIYWVLGTIIGLVIFMYISVSAGTYSDSSQAPTVDQQQLLVNGWWIGGLCGAFVGVIKKRQYG